MRFPKAALVDAGNIDTASFRDLINKLRSRLFTGFVHFLPQPGSYGNADTYIVFVKGIPECSIGQIDGSDIFGARAIRTLMQSLSSGGKFEILSYQRAELIVSLLPEGRIWPEDLGLKPVGRAGKLRPYSVRNWDETIQPAPLEESPRSVAPQPTYDQMVQPRRAGSYQAQQADAVYQQVDKKVNELERSLREKMALRSDMEGELKAMEARLRGEIMESKPSAETPQYPTTTTSTYPMQQSPVPPQASEKRKEQEEREKELQALEEKIEEKKRLLRELSSERKVTGTPVQPAETPEERIEDIRIRPEEVMKRDEAIRQRTLDIKKRIEEELRSKRKALDKGREPVTPRDPTPDTGPVTPAEVESSPTSFTPVEEETEDEAVKGEESKEKKKAGKTIFDELIEMNKELRK